MMLKILSFFAMFILLLSQLSYSLPLGTPSVMSLTTICPYQVIEEIDKAKCVMFVLSSKQLTVPFNYIHTPISFEGINSASVDGEGKIILYYTSSRANLQEIKKTLGAISDIEYELVEQGYVSDSKLKNLDIDQQLEKYLRFLNVAWCTDVPRCDQAGFGQACSCNNIPDTDICSTSAPVYEGAPLIAEEAST